MEIDKAKVDEFTLALLCLTTFKDRSVATGVEGP
jgi:hypothetical protein